ncbi:FG-GAP repeat domain-containing protein [Nonomuraea sp. NPDC003214]
MARKLGVLLVSSMLAGCAAAGPGPAAPTPPPTPESAPEPVPISMTPAAAPPSRPRCSGKAEPGDVNGDGYADLAFVRTGADWRERAQLVVVHGSARGLDPATAYVAGDGAMSGEAPPQFADLDGDGCADVVIPDRSLMIFWGGRGPAAVLPYGSHSGVADLDGDDAADLLATTSRPDGTGGRLVRLHGPFTRSGEPARRSGRPLPEGEWPGRMVTDPYGPDLVVYGPDDGEQAHAWLLTGEDFREVATGSSAVFGDFDGDGRRDVAIGDSGARNNEPGMETEDPSVESITRVFYGGADREPQVLDGVRGSLHAGDLTGDGLDDLVSGEVIGMHARVVGGAEILTGSPAGVRRPGLSFSHRGPERGPAGKRLKDWERGSIRTWSVGDHDGDGRAEVIRVWQGGPGRARFWRVDGTGATLQVFDLAGKGG